MKFRWTHYWVRWGKKDIRTIQISNLTRDENLSDSDSPRLPINQSIKGETLPGVFLGDDDVVGITVQEGLGAAEFLKRYTRIVHPVLEGVTDDLLLLVGCGLNKTPN